MPVNELRESAGHSVLRGFEWYYWWHHVHEHSLLVLPGHQQDVDALAFFPDGQRLATCAGRLVRIWDLTTDSVLQELRAPHANLMGVAISPDGKRLAVASSSNLVHLLDTRDWRVLQSLDHVDQVWSVDFAPDGRTLATGDKVGNVNHWSLAEGKLLVMQRADTGYVRAVRFTRDGLLASGSYDGAIRFWYAQRQE